MPPSQPHLNLAKMISENHIAPRVAKHLFGDEDDIDVMQTYADVVPEDLAKLIAQVDAYHAAIATAARGCPDSDVVRAFLAMYVENADSALRFLARLNGNA